MPLSRILCTVALAAAAACTALSQDYWQQTNGPEGGDVTAAVIAADGSVLATTGPLLFRSTNEGTTWSMNTALVSRTLAVAPNGKIIAGVSGVYASTDNGISWAPSGLAGKAITALGASANGNLFAAYGYPALISRSTDNGATWSLDTVGMGVISDQVVSFSPGPSGSIAVSLGFTGTFRSTNNGDTWSRLYSGSSNCVVFGSTGNIYLATSNGVLRSTNGGTNWTFKNTGLVSTSISSMLSLPNGDLLVSSDKVYRSTNSGDGWVALGLSGPLVGGVHHLLNNGNSTFYVGVYARGLFRTTDGGAVWSQQAGGFRGSSNQTIVAKPSGELVAGGYSDVFLSTDNGATWNARSGGLGAHAQLIVRLAVTPGGSLLAVSSLNANLFRSTNNGVNWSQIIPPGQIPGPFVTLPSGIVLGGGTGVYRSTNDGVNWARTSASFLQTVNALMWHSNGTMYVGASFGGVHASLDTGKTWTAKGLSGQDIRTLVETSSGAILAGVNYSGLFRTTDGGTNWTPLSTATTGNQPKMLYRAGSTTILGIFGSLGVDAVFASTDEGTTWASAATGLPVTVVPTDFATTPGGMVVASTAGPAGFSGFGVVRATGTVNGVESGPGILPEGFALSQNYPNPFNPLTRIELRIKNSEFLILKVYDMLGREVATLLNERKEPGTYLVEFDGSKLASGAYLCRMQAGAFSQTRRILLLR